MNTNANVEALYKLLALGFGGMTTQRYTSKFFGDGYVIKTTVPQNYPGIHDLIRESVCDGIYITLSECQLKVDISEDLCEVKDGKLSLLTR